MTLESLDIVTPDSGVHYDRPKVIMVLVLGFDFILS